MIGRQALPQHAQAIPLGVLPQPRQVPLPVVIAADHVLPVLPPAASLGAVAPGVLHRHLLAGGVVILLGERPVA